MNFMKLLFYIGLAIIGFWVLGLLLDFAKWILEISLIVGLVLVIISLINQYYESKKK